MENNIFEEALKNKDNTKIINAVLKKFKRIPIDERKQLGKIALWKCLKEYDTVSDRVKFTTSLFHFVRWECLGFLRSQKRYTKTKSGLSNQPELEEKNLSTIDILDCLTIEEREIVNRYYIKKETLIEIGKIFNLSKDTIRHRLEKIKNKLLSERCI